MSNLSIIYVRKLQKVYQVPVREAGISAAMVGLFKRKCREVTAVNNIDFSIEAGEVIGFLSPNGAGKTTTLKMLAGLLHPTTGQVIVMGYMNPGIATTRIYAKYR